jgi:hypothetical protein
MDRVGNVWLEGRVDFMIESPDRQCVTDRRRKHDIAGAAFDCAQMKRPNFQSAAAGSMAGMSQDVSARSGTRDWPDGLGVGLGVGLEIGLGIGLGMLTIKRVAQP